jgi:hypothetical protein
MERNALLDDLAFINKAVADDQRHIGHQERCVASLERDAHDTEPAMALLTTYRRVLTGHVAYRHQLLKRLQAMH